MAGQTRLVADDRSLGTNRTVKFYYDHATHWVTDNVNSTIAVAPGSFQSELGCSGDWDPGCLRSWLQDPDHDGIYTTRVALAVVQAGFGDFAIAEDVATLQALYAL